MEESNRFYVYIWFRKGHVPCYVGKGHGNRWKHHAVNARNPHLANIFALEREYMSVELIESRLTEAEAFELEILLISVIGRRKTGGSLVNLTDGGDGPSGYVHSEETKQLVGKLSIKAWSNPEQRKKTIAAQNAGKSTPEFHKKRQAASSLIWKDEERRRKMSLLKKAYFSNPEIRKKFSDATRIGMARPEVREKLSKAQNKRFSNPIELEKLRKQNLGRKHSQETKDKMSASHIGQKRSLESRAKMSAWQIGRKMSPEACLKMSAESKRRCQNPEYIKMLSRAGKLGAAKRWNNPIKETQDI